MDWKEFVILVVIALLLLVAMRFGRRQGKDTRAERLMKKYAVMTREMIVSAPEGELVDGAVSRVLAKAAEARRPDPVVVLASLPHANTVVYAVWVVCKEMAASGYAVMMKTAAREFADMARESFAAIGAQDCAAAWEVLHTAEDKTDELESALRAAIQTECPLSLCEDYIRDHAEDFLDAPAE